KPASLRPVFGLPCQTANLWRIKILAQWCRSRHDEPPGFAMLNLTRLHLGIAHESQFQGLGISYSRTTRGRLSVWKVKDGEPRSTMGGSVARWELWALSAPYGVLAVVRHSTATSVGRWRSGSGAYSCRAKTLVHGWPRPKTRRKRSNAPRFPFRGNAVSPGRNAEN